MIQLNSLPLLRPKYQGSQTRNDHVVEFREDWVSKKDEPERDKTNGFGSDQVRHKPGYTVTEDGNRLEILDLESRGIVLSV